jgi:ACS family glucarate transporter-like MFS transporter
MRGTPGRPSAVAEPRTRSHAPRVGSSQVRWRILLLIVAASFVSYLLRSNLSIAGPAMIAELGLSELQLGTVLSAFALGYTIFQFPGGIFGDVVGPRRAVTWMALAWGLLTLLCALVPGGNASSNTALIATLVALRFLVGVTQAPIFPVMTGGMVSNWFPVSSWGLPNGLSSAGLTLGAAATGPLIVWLISGLGWRGSFVATAPVAFLLAGVWWWYTRDHPGEHAGVARSELELIEAGRTPPDAAARERGVWKAALRNREILLLTASYFCMNYVFYLFFNWFFYYLVEVRGFAEEQAASLTAAQWVIGAVGATLGGLLCDGTMRRFGARRGARVLPVVGLVGSALLLALGAWATEPLLAVALLAGCFGMNQLTEASFWATTISVAGRHASAAAGVLNTGGNLVGFFGALLVPMTAQALGWPWAIASGALVAMLGAVLWIWIRGDRPMATDAPVAPRSARA